MLNLRIFNRDLEDSLYIFSLFIAFISISGFGLYRLTTKDYSLALIDFSVSIFLAYTLKHVLCKTFSDKHRYMLLVVCMIAVIGVIYSKGSSEIYWAYPPITGAFFFIGLRKAVPLNIIFILFVLGIVWPNIPLPQFFSILITLILICAFGYTFSARAEFRTKECVKLADLDPLTNLKNRRTLKQELKNEISFHKMNIQKSSLLVLDLDHFKRINDTYGHTIGDQVLVKFAKMLKNTVRETDKIFRYGGEEFIIIANNTRLKNAGKLAEYIRKATENTIHIEGNPVTVSIGVAEVSIEDTDLSWLHRADHALYKAKDKNRNLVYLAYGNNDNCTYKPLIKTAIHTQPRRATPLQ